MIVTIDGPSGSGKSTLSVLLAKELCFFCLNSGYLYRGVAYVLKTFYSYKDEMFYNPNLVDINVCFDSGKLRYDYIEGLSHVFWGNDDITQFLKQVEITKAASVLAQCDGVRKVIVKYEHFLIKDKDVVIEGRACGSVQFPNADVKFYITASSDIRANREMMDLVKRGSKITKEQVLSNIIARDKLDKERQSDPLIIPTGAIILDTSNLNQSQMLEKAINIVRKIMK